MHDHHPIILKHGATSVVLALRVGPGMVRVQHYTHPDERVYTAEELRALLALAAMEGHA
jgi:hypothetical protein